MRALPPVGVLLAALACAPTDPSVRFAAHVQEVTPEILREEGVPGAAVTVVDRDGVVWSGGFGTTGGPTPRPVDADTLFNIQSITKVLTASAVLLAVQDGTLELDRPITAWLPDFRVHTRFAPHPERRITLRHLLSHRAGLAAEAPVGSIYTRLDEPFQEHVASISQTWLRYPVDSTYAYSNPGFSLAGHVLAVASGKSFPEFVEQRLLATAGMSRSVLAHEHIEAEPNRALPHGPFEYPVTMALAAAGGIYSSANDMARFVQLHLRGGRVGDRVILTPESLREMYTVPSPVSSFQSSGYALGLAVGRMTLEDRDIEIVGHDGGGVGFSTSAQWARDLGLGYVVLQNLNGARGLIQSVQGAFYEALEALALEEPARPPIEYEEVECLEADERTLRRFEGVYHGRLASVVVEVRDGALGILGSRFTPLCLVSKDVAVEPEKGLANAYRLTLGPDGLPVRVTGLNTGKIYDYNDGPRDPMGAARRSWRSHLSVYVHAVFGEETAYRVIEERRGHLYLDDFRLAPGPEPGLFFSGMGKVLDLRGEPPTWDGTPLRRSERGLTAEQRDASVETARRFVAAVRDGDLDAALAALPPQHRTDAIRSAIEGAWSSLVERFGPYQGDGGAEVVALGDTTRVDLEGLFATSRVLLRVEIEPKGQLTTVRLGPRSSWWAYVPREAPAAPGQ